MKRLRTLALMVLIAVAPVAIVSTQTGCATNRTTEAKVFDSFKTTYNFAYHAYESYVRLVVQGKVTKENEAKADAAWNQFRSGFSIAFKAANLNWEAATPAEVTALANQFNALLQTLLQ